MQNLWLFIGVLVDENDGIGAMKKMLVLGVETSCDETALAIYSGEQGILAHVLHTQAAMHAEYGGVVPELASRDHIQRMPQLTRKVMQEANLQFSDLEGIAYTSGPGLIGALMVGAAYARSLAYSLNIPSVGVHHLEAHLLAASLEDEKPDYPYLALLVSGGHTMLAHVVALGSYQILGETLDDAVGEAFDKTAKKLGLGYPGGARLAKLAAQGQPSNIRFPRPMCDRPGLDFSFSGLKTAALQAIQASALDGQRAENIAYAFQEAVVDTLVRKSKRALEQTGLKRLVIAGGVGANQLLRQRLQEFGEEQGIRIYYPRIEYCTDNGAMVAYVGYLRLMRGERASLEIDVRARWALEDL